MNETIRREYEQVFKERADCYRLLSSLYFKEVSEEFIEALSVSSLEFSENKCLKEGFASLKNYLLRRGPDPRTDLAVDYARVFLAAGIYEGEAANPYESIYTSKEGLIMQDARDEVRLIYLRQGVNVNGELNLPEDHLSFELEFLAIMSDKAREALEGDDTETLIENLALQRSFVESHLLDWLPDLFSRIITCARQPFYPAIMQITLGFIEEDRALLDEMLGKSLRRVSA